MNMDEVLQIKIIQNYQQVLEQIEKAAKRAGRNPSDIQVVLVTKNHSIDTIQAALKTGILHLGENYTDEAIPKIETLKHFAGLQWHMIGHVQSRKAEAVANHFDYMHSLDSVKLAMRLDRSAVANNRKLPVLVQCNTSGEASKSGMPVWDQSQWPALLDELAQIAELKNIGLHGLMTMAPFSECSEDARPYFRKLSKLRNYLQPRLPGVQLAGLSMGMSGDFEIAVEEGATWVRIGQRILGPRQI